MKFAFVITNLAGGGAEKVVLTLASGLAGRGHDVDVVLLERRIEHKIPEGITPTCLTEKAPRGWLGKRYLAWRLARYLAQPVDLVISALPFANEVAILANLPHHWCRIDNTLGSEIDKLALTNPDKARRRLRRYRTLYNARPLIAISNGMIDDLRTRIGVTGRIEKISNPFDFDAIRRDATMNFVPERPYVIHIGRFNTQKRHDLLLDAWVRVATDRELVLLTAANPALQAMIDERGLAHRVRIAGFQTNPYPWIANADLLVLSSDHEGLSNVLIEALGCGTPVVSTDCPSGPREILAALPECLVPCGNAERLAAAMTHCLATPPNPSCADLSAYDIHGVLDAYERLAAECHTQALLG